MTTTDAVLFDIDGTLCEYERTTAEMLPIAFERAGVDPFFSATEYIERYEDFIAESADVADHRERCFVDIAREKDEDPALARAVARAYEAERTHSNVVWLDGATETLDTLRGEYRLAAVTNGGPAMQSAKLDALGVDCFETVVHAGYDTAAKPDPEPFETALDTLGVEASQALYVGDSLRSDVAGGHNAGLPVAWLGAEPIADTHPTPEYVLDSPRDLLGTLGLA
jgi:putative hydrolase of the HAD superfamily